MTSCVGARHCSVECSLPTWTHTHSSQLGKSKTPLCLPLFGLNFVSDVFMSCGWHYSSALFGLGDLTKLTISEKWLAVLGSPWSSQMLQFRRFTDSVRYQQYKTTGLDAIWTITFSLGLVTASFKKIFNLPNHSIFDMILQGIEALGNHREIVCLSREKLWIRRLQTIRPHGLNI